MDDIYKELTILYVEDDASIQEGYSRALKRYCQELILASDGIEGYEKFLQHKPDIIISDINMPKSNGLEMAKKIKQIDSKQPIIFTTAYSDSNYTVEALELQVEGYLLKPVDKTKLQKRVEKLAKAIYLEKENKKQQIIIDHIVKSSSSIIVLTDFKHISFASNSFFQLHNLSSLHEFYTKYNSFFDLFVQHKDYLFADNKEEFLSKYNNLEQNEKIVSILDNKNQPKAFTLHIDRIEIEDKTQYLLTLSDVSKIQAQKKAYEHQAFFDALTGIANRAKFERTFHGELKRFQRYDNTFSVAIMDIDHFKDFNDNYGHLVGDEMLIAIANMISGHIREFDTFARWGGEEFILLMPQTQAQDAVKVCDNLRKKIHTIKHEIAGSITMSFGVSEVTKGDTLNSLFKRCDKALYQAKNSGRDKVESI
ncbi:MAG: diguanylate cyclase [Campylobacterota bacterium]